MSYKDLSAVAVRMKRLTSQITGQPENIYVCRVHLFQIAQWIQCVTFIAHWNQCVTYILLNGANE